MLDFEEKDLYNDVLIKLQDYILDEENIRKSLKMKMVTDKMATDKMATDKNSAYVDKPKKDTNSLKQEITIPQYPDSLFWCYFILANGDIKYETLPYKNVLISKQIKIELVTLIRTKKDIIKTYKFDTISNIESNLANDNNLSPKTFLTLCAIENINIIYISKKTYYELMMNDTDIIYIVYEIQSNSKYFNKYGYELGTEEKINKIKSNHYKLDKIDKQMKSISSYKVEDLVNICNKLAIETTNKDNGKTKSKKDLYESIIQYF
jgi:hypothetical protein